MKQCKTVRKYKEKMVLLTVWLNGRHVKLKCKLMWRGISVVYMSKNKSKYIILKREIMSIQS